MSQSIRKIVRQEGFRCPERRESKPKGRKWVIEEGYIHIKERKKNRLQPGRSYK